MKERSGRKSRYVMVIDLDRCTGCGDCMVACSVENNVPVPFQQNAHHWLILHGRYICQARRPRCKICPIEDLCPFEEKTE